MLGRASKLEYKEVNEMYEASHHIRHPDLLTDTTVGTRAVDTRSRK